MFRLRYCLLAVTLSASVPLSAADQQEMAPGVEQRLQRMERLLSSQSLLEMSQRIEALQTEVQLLRGQLEEQQHTITEMKERQRELYMDVDRRLTLFEREGAAAPGGMPATTPDATPSGSQSASGSAETEQDEQRLAEERQAYQEAFDMLRELRYAQATGAFRSFLKQYPDGRYAHLAQYWLAEAAYAQRNFKQAIDDYRLLLQKYPDSPKRAETMLKVGYSYYELKQTEQATQILNQLIEQYPDSTEAGQARRLLKQISKQAG